MLAWQLLLGLLCAWPQVMTQQVLPAPPPCWLPLQSSKGGAAIPLLHIPLLLLLALSCRLLGPP
jgi:hypothetical protein